MKNFLKSLFGSADAADAKSDAPPEAEAPPPTTAKPAPAAAPASGSDLSVEAIVDDLVAHILTTMPDPRPASEIDLHVHMFDAGYVTSISAADLLAHIQATYGLDISETKLIGPLQNIQALAAFIKQPTP